MRLREAAIRLIAAGISLALCLVVGELALRVVYRDAGERTLGGPGGRPFDHQTLGEEGLRGRRDVGPRVPGVPRLMVVGDSITWGLGVRRWQRTWPELLARDLEKDGGRVEMAVFSMPGNNIPDHLEAIEHWGADVSPDALIYQWYVNDIEVMSNRPLNRWIWQQWASHPWLRRVSYLYFFLDNRLTQWLPAAERSYTDYFLEDFVPGRTEWVEFERVFHAFAVNAQAVAPQRIMLLYPQVPYRGSYPLEPIHTRMKEMAGNHTLHIPLAAWHVSAGTLAPSVDASWDQALYLSEDDDGPVIETLEYLFAPGTIDLELTLAVLETGDADVEVGICEVVDAVSNEVIAAAPVHLSATGSFQTVHAKLDWQGTDLKSVRFRLSSLKGHAWAVANLGVQVDYGWKVVDLAEPLNQFQTHASIFDAHPNEAAHRVIADYALQALDMAVH